MPPNKTRPQWQKLVEKKQKQIASLIPTNYKLPQDLLDRSRAGTNVTGIIAAAISAAERQITELPLHELLDALLHGRLTCQEVLTAFFHRAVVAHQLVHCLSEINYEAALRRALEIDAHWRQYRTPIGPLHGLPVSLMDRYHVAGLDSACGFASWTGRPHNASDEGGIVTSLYKLGAIVFCKTAVPMSTMMGETASNVVGTTVNPFNSRLSAGGACGGEGALIACKGSPFGLGTDVAGSSRIPSTWNGLWTLKCSEERLPISGTATTLSGLPVSNGAVGLLSGDLKGLLLVFQALLSANTSLIDPNVISIPWRQHMHEDIHQRSGQAGKANGRLCLGIMACDGHVRPQPTITRAIELAKLALTQCGHEIVEWSPPPHFPAVENLFKIFGSTCMAEARHAIDASHEPPVPQLKAWYDQTDAEPSSSAEFWALCAKRTEYRAAYAAYMASVGDKTRSGRMIDGIILPVTPTTAVRPENFRYYGYSAIANVLDFAAGTIPITVGDRNLDRQDAAIEALNDVDGLVLQTFDSSDIHGMSIGLQVMCPRLQEEQVLALMQAVWDAVQQV